MASRSKMINEVVTSCDECPYGDVQKNKIDPEYFWVVWCRYRDRVIGDYPGQSGDNLPEVNIPKWCPLMDANQ